MVNLEQATAGGTPDRGVRLHELVAAADPAELAEGISQALFTTLIGLAIAFFLARDDLAPEWRLFVVTGLLGGLTTFSTYSAEVTELAMRGEHAAAFLLAMTHLAGSLILTAAGFATFRALAS